MWGNVQTSTRKGIMLFLVLGAIVSLALLFFMLSTHSVQTRYTTVRVMEEEFANQATQIIAECFWETLQEVFRTKSGSSYLFPTPEINSPLNVNKASCEAFQGNITLNLFKQKHFSSGDLIQKELQNRFPELDNIVCEASLVIQNMSDDQQSLELYCVGMVELHINFTMKKSHIEYKSTFRRTIKIAQTIPPVVSKFTLFVRNVGTPEYFNICKKKFNDDNSPSCKILYLYNAPAAAHPNPDAWKQSGWVFLGGSEININLDGTTGFSNESEYFLFSSNPARTQGDFFAFTCSDYLRNTKMRMYYHPMGCFADILSPNSDSFLHALADPLSVPEGPQDAQRLESISALRLYGDKVRPSPTRIIGNVFARYFINSSLIFDPNDDGCPYDLERQTSPSDKVTMSFVIPRLTNSGRFDPPFYPTLLDEFDQQYDIANDFGDIEGLLFDWKFLFPNFEGPPPDSSYDYKTAMCKISRPDFPPEEASFNRMYDTFFEGHVSPGTERKPRFFPPKERLINPAVGTNDDYPRKDDDPNFTLYSDGLTGDKLFTGNLKELYSGDKSYYNPNYLTKGKYAAIYNRVYSNQAEFKADWTVKTGTSQEIVLDKPMIAMIDGPLSITDKIIVKAPITLVAQKTLEIADAENVAPTARLVLVSQSGDVSLLGKDPLIANILAPTKTLKWKYPLKLTGTVFVNTLDVNQIQASGGFIEYDPSSDCTDPKNLFRGLAFMLGPNLPAPLVAD